MGWRFRHSFKVIPGVRLNLSKSGLSCSIGGAPLTMNIGPRGVYGTASIPGTGISYRQRFGGSSETQPSPTPAAPVFPASADPHSLPAVPSPFPSPGSFSAPVGTMPVQEVHSASTELLTSNSLKELKQIIQTAYVEHEDISHQLETARQEKERASRRFLSWENGFLFKKIFKASFAKRKAEAETATAKVAELEEQLRLTTIATQVPVVLYASLSLKSDTGLWEEFQFLNPERLQIFLQDWAKFVASFGAPSH